MVVFCQKVDIEYQTKEGDAKEKACPLLQIVNRA